MARTLLGQTLLHFIHEKLNSLLEKFVEDKYDFHTVTGVRYFKVWIFDYLYNTVTV